MPIFDKELMGSSIGNTDLPTPKPVLGSPTPTKVNTGGFNAPETGSTGLGLDQLSNLAKTPSGPATFNSPFQAVPKSELLANQRYPMYQRNADLENIYGLQQGWASQLANGVIKMGATAVGTFAQSLSNIPNTVSAIKNGELKDLSGNPDGYEGSIDNWLKNIEDKFPNYYTRYEQQHPFLAAIPGFTGSGNFWGDKFIKNIGFTIGAIGGAVAQDAVLGMATEGIGEIPLVANQVGKAALWLNKLFTGSNDLDKVLELGTALGKTEKQLLNIQKLGELAAATKVANGFRYGMGIIGSAQTEAGVEGRDGYNQVKKELTNQYKLSHLGEDPIGEDAKQIEDYATSAMNTRFGINMGLLTVSNAIQFDNLFKSIGNATKGVTSGLTKELEDAGKLGLKEGSLDVFERKVPTKLSEKVWDAVRPKVANIFAEGVYEEGGQYAAERGTYDYYTRKYKNLNDPANKKNWNDLQEILKSTSYGLGEQFGTTEGWENMFIGGLTAVATGWAESKIDRSKGQGKDARLNSAINILNQYGLSGVLSNKFDNTLDSVGIAKDMQAAADKGDVFQYKNLQHNMFFNFVQSRIPSGMHDVTIEQLGMLKDLSKEDFEKTFGMDFNASNKQTVNQYVDGMIAEANNIKKTTDSINNTFKNPFKQVADHKNNEEQQLENAKFNIFEKWKTDLAYYATVAPNINNRLESIQQDVANINPAISNDLLGKLTNKESLEELAKSYEETAANLNKSIIDGMTADERNEIKNQVKAYRTQSEKINLAISNKNLDDKTFEGLLNFELNGQLPVKDKLVGSEHIADLYNFGHDVNRANALKQRASDIYDDLSTKNGFDKYFEQAEKMAEQEVPEEEATIETPDVEEPTGPQFTNKEGDKEAIELNREYQLPEFKEAKVAKIDDNRWQVTAPNGDVTFHSTEEKANAAADELNKDFTDLSKVKVLAVNSDGTIKVEDKNGDIQNISADQLAGYERIQTRQEQLLRFADRVNKEQKDLENTSGTVATGDNDANIKELVSSITFEDKKKGVSIMFPSTKTESEDWQNPLESAPHITRSREFLSKVGTFENRNNLRVILVTLNNEEALGLKGLAALSYNKNRSVELTDEEIAKIGDINKGFLAQVFVQYKDGIREFVDKDGKPITEGDVLNHIIFQTMPTTELVGYDREGKEYNLYRSGEKEAAEAEQKGYIEFREQLFANTTADTPIYDFSVSRGIPVENIVNGVRERNSVKESLLPKAEAERLIATQKGLVTVSTDGTVQSASGMSYKFPLGMPVFLYGDTVVGLNNAKFDNDSSKTVYELIKTVADNVAELGKVKPQMVFLQNVLYWKKTAGSKSQNQIYIDEKTMDLYLGEKKYDLSDIANLEKEITGQLKDIWANVNNNSLTKNFDSKFREFYYEDGEMKNRVWDNYQSYLLSTSYPDGSSRTMNNVPLSTAVAKTTDERPFNFKQKYSTLVGLEFTKPKAKVVEEITPEPVAEKIGDYIAGGKTENTIPYKEPIGDTKFTYVIDNGVVKATTITNDAIKATAEDNALVDKYRTFLPTVGVTPKTSNEDVVLQFLDYSTSARLEKIKEEAPTAAPVVEEKKEEKPVAPPATGKRFTRAPKDEYRRFGKDKAGRITEEEIALFKEWAQKNVPGIPFEVLDNIITTYDGEKAWGVFEDSVAKFYKGAVKGTEYHEVFEGVYKGFLSPAEQQDLLNEFKARKGEFIDRQSGKKIAFADATDQEAKERIADDFAEFRLGKLPAKTLGEKVRKFFRDIINFVKEFIGKPSKKEQLFKAIDTGKFKEAKLAEEVKYAPSEFRAVENLTDQETNDFVQDMVIRASQILFGEHLEDIYDFRKITGNQLFGEIEEIYSGEEQKRQELGDKAWEQLVTKTKDSLRTLLGLQFNDEDVVDFNDDNNNNREYTRDPFTIGKKDASYGIKLLFGTLPLTTNRDMMGALPERRTDSSVAGYRLLDYGKAFSTVINKLSNTTGDEEAAKKLAELARSDKNYVRAFVRLGGDINALKEGSELAPIDFSKFTPAKWRLWIDFTQTFTKQQPNVVVQYVNGNKVHIGDANLFTAAKNLQDNWVQNIKAISKEKGSLITYDRTTKTYNANIPALDKVKIDTKTDKVKFLNDLGVILPLQTYLKFTLEQQAQVDAEASKILSYVKTVKKVASITGKTLSIDGRFKKIAEILARATNPLQENVRTSIDGKTRQAYAQNNALSLFANEFNQAETLDQLLKSRPELKDVFSTNSIFLKKGGIFWDAEGNKRGPKILVGAIEGTLDELKDKGKATVKLGKGERFTQEFNQNLKGNYYVIIAADSATEWQMNMGNHVSFEDIQSGVFGNEAIQAIMKGYLQDDVALALDYEKRQELRNVGNRGKELRFFKDILSNDKLEPSKILTTINNMIVSGNTEEEINKYVNDNIADINAAIDKYITDKSDKLKETLRNEQQIQVSGENTYSYFKLDDDFAHDNSLKKNELSEYDVDSLTKFVTANTTINNIEFHKTIFGDPYQFETKIKNGKSILDETKRIKSFESPASTTYDSDAFNNYHNKEYNKTGLVGEENRIALKPGEPGYTSFKPYVNTVTISDVMIDGRLLGETNETDASSIMMDSMYRQVKLRNKNWNKEAEAWHQWQMAYTRNKLAAKDEYDYDKNEKLKAHDEKIISEPAPAYVTEVLKPIVRGNKYGKDNFDLVLDKFSQMPLYYSMVEGKTLEKLYIKMLKEEKDYVIAVSGRKVGAESLHNLYVDGKFNDAPFNNNIQVAWKTYGIQVENTYDDKNGEVTTGSQITKMASMNLFSNGLATSPEAAAEYARNVRIKNEILTNGYNSLLKRLGVKDNGITFDVVDRTALAESLEYEMLRREVSDNTKETVQLNKEGEFPIPFESSFAYKQIKDIIYSMVDKSITHAKTAGGAYVQTPVTGWEDASKGRRVVEINGKKVLTDDTLKFYTKDQPYCEILIPHWFKNVIGKSKRFDTDEKILKYLNTTVEGREILKGIGFRIPTQSLSSIESFKVKGFLPASMGKTVVVPSEITTKAGSDFDIDKLNVYLKSVYLDRNGDLRSVDYKGSEQATRDFYNNVFNEVLESKKIKKAELLEAVQIAAYDLEDTKGLVEKYGSLLDALLEGAYNSDNFEADIMKQLKKLGDANLQAGLREKFVDSMYKKALENEYYDSLGKMLALPENFDSLVEPVDDGGLSKIADKLNTLRGQDESKIKNRILDGVYLTNLRHAFAIAKGWVGIAATNLTNLSLVQKAQVYIDPMRINKLDESERQFLGDGKMLLKHNGIKIGDKTYVSFSSVTDRNGKLISSKLSGYATAFVDVAKDPYILDIIKSDLAVSTFLFLERAGVPNNTVAMFMNQPIIDMYLQTLDAHGINTLFNVGQIRSIVDAFPASKEALAATTVMNEANFEKNIATFYKPSVSLNDVQNAEQHIILREFIKYAKMAEHAFDMNQAINYDTTTFSNGDALHRKQYRTEKALESNIFAGIEEVMNKTFLKTEADLLDNSVEAIGEILPLEKDEFTQITNQVLAPFTKNKYVSNDKFNETATKIKLSFLDYIIQTKTNINQDIQTLLSDTTTAIDTQLVIAQKEHPEMTILNELEIAPNKNEEGATTVKLKANLKNDAHLENLYTGYMRELRDNPSTNALYNNLVKVSILQGMYKTPISIGNIIPIEDRSKLITPVIKTLVRDGELEAFATLGMFQKNNWKNDDVMKQVEPKFRVLETDAEGTAVKYTSTGYFPAVERLGIASADRKILKLSEKWNYIGTQYDFVRFPRFVVETRKGVETGRFIDVVTGNNISLQQKTAMEAAGNLLGKQMFGYQRVKDINDNPFTIYENGEKKHIYKQINLLGDGQLAAEYYSDTRKSVLNNNTVKVEKELTDEEIRSALQPLVKKDISLPDKTTNVNDNPQYSNIFPLQELKTWDLGTYEGTPQTKEAQEEIDQILINTPDALVGGGESFNSFSDRILGKAKDMVENAPANSVILTHNAAFGLIKLWNKNGRPETLSEEFRKEYTQQDSKTGDFFKIEGKNGDVYIIRHGETVDNLNRNFRKANAELTNKGIQEAIETGQALKDVKLGQMSVSALPRAVHTANLIMSQQGAEEKEEKEIKCPSEGGLSI